MSFPALEFQSPICFSRSLSDTYSTTNKRKNQNNRVSAGSTGSQEFIKPKCELKLKNHKGLTLSTEKSEIESTDSKSPINNILMIQPYELADKLKNERKAIMLVDVRSPKLFNLLHIAYAINPLLKNCMMKNKLEKKTLKLKNLISCPLLRNESSNNSDLIIVLYNDNSKQCEISEILQKLYDCLIKDGKTVRILEGGLQLFVEEFPELCFEKIPEPLLFSPTTPIEEQNVDIDSAPVAKILDFLFIGNWRDASNKDLLTSNGITHILNVTAHLPQYFENDGITYHRLLANDSSEQNLRQFFEDAYDFIESSRKNHGKVLVHCLAGVSRSATIVISYLLRKCKISSYEVYRFLKTKRDIVAPNLNFMGQLMNYEKELNNSGNRENSDLNELYSFEK